MMPAFKRLYKLQIKLFKITSMNWLLFYSYHTTVSSVFVISSVITASRVPNGVWLSACQCKDQLHIVLVVGRLPYQKTSSEPIYDDLMLEV